MTGRKERAAGNEGNAMDIGGPMNGGNCGLHLHFVTLQLFFSFLFNLKHTSSTLFDSVFPVPRYLYNDTSSNLSPPHRCPVRRYLQFSTTPQSNSIFTLDASHMERSIANGIRADTAPEPCLSSTRYFAQPQVLFLRLNLTKSISNAP